MPRNNNGDAQAIRDFAKDHGVPIADLKISGNFRPFAQYNVGNYDTSSFNPLFRKQNQCLFNPRWHLTFIALQSLTR